MEVTVAICTWNRHELLRQTLEQMTRVVVPPGITWEVLVVNNNCTDSTDAVLASFSERLPLRRLFEPFPGKSHALNHAVREAAGDYIVWSDDDVLFDEQWLAAYCRAFERWPDAAVFGGSILPWFAGTPPEWLRRTVTRLGGVYAVREPDAEPAPITLTPLSLPFGANMAVRTTDQRRFTFDTSLGPRPGNPFGGEETALVRAMLASGATGWWVPDARVRHYIAEHRQTTRYVRNYFLGYGRSLARDEPVPSGRTIFGRPVWLWRQLVEAEARYRLGRLARKPEVWIEDLITAGMSRGQFVEYGARARPAARSGT
jgi:glycosyltransferase involved in cell wall biosynthesis